MRYFRVREDTSAGHTGFVDAAHKWGLPGILRCPACHATWSGGAKAYPSVDLSSVSMLADFEQPRAEPIEEYERLCALVRPFLPPGAQLEPGGAFGPLVGDAKGQFAQFVANYSFLILVRQEAFAKLQSEPVRGLKGCRMEVCFPRNDPTELLELELASRGRAHGSCLPLDREPACRRCHRQALALPSPLILDASTLPPDLDLFRLEDFPTVVVCTSRFIEACQRLDLDGLSFTPLAAR